MKPPKKVKLTVIPSSKDEDMHTLKSEAKEPKINTYDPRPQFSIGVDEFPEIKDWVTGKKYKLEIEVEQTGSRIKDWGNNKGKLEGTYKITKIGSDNDADEVSKNFPAGMKKK